MSSPYFEDLEVGRKYKSRVGRTITEFDNIWFTLMTNNTNQIHFNSDYVKREYPGKPFEGKLVVNGFLTLSVVTGLLVEYTSQRGFMLGMENVSFKNPVFPGDTLYAECEVTERRESRSNPNFGIVKIKTTGYNQKGEVVVEFTRTFMVPKKKTNADNE